jgi:hypothetical protein
VSAWERRILETIAQRAQYVEILTAVFIKQYGSASVLDYTLVEERDGSGLRTSLRFERKEPSEGREVQP